LRSPFVRRYPTDDLMDLRLEDLAKEIGSGRRVAHREVEREGMVRR